MVIVAALLFRRLRRSDCWNRELIAKLNMNGIVYMNSMAESLARICAIFSKWCQIRGFRKITFLIAVTPLPHMVIANDVPCTTQSENTVGVTFADNSCGGSESSITFNVTEDLTISDLNVGLNISVLIHRHHFQVVLTSPQGTSVVLVPAPLAPNWADNVDIMLDSDGSGPILDADDDNLAAPYYDRVALPFNSLDAFDGENAMGTWTMTICDDNYLDYAIGGTLNRAILVFEGTCPATGPTFPGADYTIDMGGTINTCNNATFADAGDTNADYGNNENHSMTFCSDMNNHISFTFEHFNTEAGTDFLNIYDGSSTAAASLGSYSGFGEANSPGVVTSSGSCLTFQFSSNGGTTAPGWLARISCTGLAPPSAVSGSWSGYPTGSTCNLSSQIGGRVYEDIDNDGLEDAFDTPVYGVAVYLFDDNGQTLGPLYTDVNGEYTFNGLAASTVYRIEFEVPDNFMEGPYGNQSGTSVQFIESGNCDANLGLVDPAHYCGELDPYWVIPCYNNGDPQHSSNIDGTAVARFRYSDSGNSPAPSYVKYLTLGAVGSTWGVAHSTDLQNLYVSSVLKRHVGLGPGGIGAIYMHNDGAANTSAPVFYDFGSAAGTVASNATRFPGTGSSFGLEGPCGTCDNVDPSTFAQVAKVGFGDIDINPEQTKLYVTNLYDRKVYSIDISNPTAGSASPLPGMPWLDNSVCSNGIARPWALEWRRDKLFVGVICDASLSACAIGTACPDLSAEVFSFDGSSWTNELSLPLDYYREAYSKGSDYFVKWLDNWSDMSAFVNNVTDANFAQPILMDLEFDDDNSLILGIGDRSGLQMGYMSANPTATSDNTSERNMAFGDILRAAYDPVTDTYTIENDGVVGNLTTTNPTASTGPGGKSFYWGDYWTGFGAERYQGGIGPLALLPGSGEVMFPLGDAIDYYSNGVSWIDNFDGSTNKRMEVYQGVADGNSPNFSKGSGVGDMELMCSSPPNIEIGNIVWWDENLDGLQDPSEMGIANVLLELWQDPNGNTQGNNAQDGDEIKIAETTTDSYGRYIFSYEGNDNGLNVEDWSFTGQKQVEPKSFYQVRIPNWTSDAGIVSHRNSLGYAGHLMSATQNQTGSAGATGIGRDSNGYDNPGNAAGTVSTGTIAENDHSFDFGFGGLGGCEAPEVIPTANTPCEGEALNLMASVSGGQSPYSYEWTGPNGFTSLISNPSIASADSSLHAGIYTLLVTDDVACTDTVHLHVVVNRVDATIVTTDATCGSSDGAADLSISNGYSPFTYSWSHGATSEDVSGLASGSYIVTVTDSDGCTDIETAAINSTGSPILSETHVDATCGLSNGSIDLQISGSYTTISWSNGASTQDLSGLASGTYTVTVNNASNCPAILSVSLSDSPMPSLSTTQVNTVCGNDNGSIDLTVSGGTAPYSYQWDNDGIADNDDVEDLSMLLAGSYSVTVTDAENCTVSTTVSITNTSGPSLSTTASNESCGQSNGSINLSVSGGTSPYSYEWNNGLTTEDISGLGTGTFTVAVTDANDCIAVISETVSNISGPTLTAAPTDASDCLSSDGAIDLGVTGGVPGYSYTWNTGATSQDISNLPSGSYLVTVTDANGCVEYMSVGLANAADPVLNIEITDPVNCGDTGSVDLTISNGSSPYSIDWSLDGLGDNDDSEDQAGLEGGVYTVVVTDAIGCSTQGNASIKVIRPPALSGILTSPSCGNADGAIDLSISDPDAGASPSYSFIWSNGATTEDLSGLTAGNYEVTVSNNLNCSSEIEFSLSDLAAPDLDIFSTNPSCSLSNGGLDLSVAGGTSPYAYTWSTGSNSEDLSGIPSGDYQVTVTDAAGCVAVASTNLTSTQASTIDALISPESCGNADGMIDLTVSGVSPFIYDWSDNSLDGLEDPTGLSGGNYTVTVTDANSCPGIASFTVPEVSEPAVTAIATAPSCSGGSALNNGTITLAGFGDERYDLVIGSSYNGSVTTYAMATDIPADGQIVNDLPNPSGSQEYSIRIINSNNCLVDRTVTLSEVNCCQGDCIQINVTINN